MSKLQVIIFYLKFLCTLKPKRNNNKYYFLNTKISLYLFILSQTTLIRLEMCRPVILPMLHYHLPLGHHAAPSNWSTSLPCRSLLLGLLTWLVVPCHHLLSTSPCHHNVALLDSPEICLDMSSSTQAHCHTTTRRFPALSNFCASSQCGEVLVVRSRHVLASGALILELPYHC